MITICVAPPYLHLAWTKRSSAPDRAVRKARERRATPVWTRAQKRVVDEFRIRTETIPSNGASNETRVLEGEIRSAQCRYKLAGVSRVAPLDRRGNAHSQRR